MAINCATCGDSIWDLLRKILDRLNSMVCTCTGGGGTGTSNAVMGSQAIAEATDFVTVVFPIPFASAPKVVASMARPSGGFLIYLNVAQNTITATGFTAELSASTPFSGYVIHYIASIS